MRAVRFRQQRAQALAVEKLHDEVRGPVGQLAEVADVDDVLVADRARGAGLLQEALVELVVVRHLAAQDLDGDPLVDHLVAGRVDDAHTAFAEDAVDDVAAVDRLADVRIDLGGRGASALRGGAAARARASPRDRS